jgi:hypothetical protein
VARQARILLICDDRQGGANTILDHINAFRKYSRHDIKTFNTRGMAGSVSLDLDDFDVVVLHYSVLLSYEQYVSAAFRDKLRRFRGLKVEFIQDDYRWVDRATAASRDAGIGVLFTVAPEPAASQLYDQRLPGVRRVQTLTGYVPDNLRDLALTPLPDRTIDVGYRARDLPFWMGRLSREKVWVGQGFLQRAPASGLRCDIAWTEHDRIYGRRWIEFVSSSRATLGAESGASIADFDGSVEARVQDYLAGHPGASYEEVHDSVLRPYEGNVVVNVVSPRVFEAAALGTAMVMFPGEYSGVVSPGVHYIVLEKDFSNFDEVVERLRDGDFIAGLTARAHADLIMSGRWSYRTFIAEFDRVVDEEAKTMRGPSSSVRYHLARAERTIRATPVKVRAARIAHGAWSRVSRRESMRFAVDNESQIQKGLLALRVGIRDRDLRGLLRVGRRSGARLDRLLREVLELSLLRKAAAGTLPGQSFVVDAEFDAARGAACFISVPLREGGPPLHRHGAAIRAALGRGELKVIEWDHRALGGTIELDQPRMVVGIGSKGMETFTIIAGIGRQSPADLERAFGPVLASTDLDRTTLPVG